MTIVLLPPPRVALRLPAVRSAALMVVLSPAFVLWWRPADQAPVRLRVIGMLLAATLALVWDDRCATITAPTPVGVPAVRRGRSAVLLGLLLLAWLLACLAAAGAATPRTSIPYAAICLQSATMAAVLLAVVGWHSLGREGESLLALPLPVLLVTLALAFRLPADLALLHAMPGTEAWPAERTRWVVLLVVAGALVLRCGRDPGCWPMVQRLRTRHP